MAIEKSIMGITQYRIAKDAWHVLKNQPVPGFFRHMGTDGGKDKGRHDQEFYRYPAMNCHPDKDQLNNRANADHLPEKLPVPYAFSDQQHSAAY